MKIPEHLLPFLSKLKNTLEEVLADNLIGLYVHGSLTYGGYVRERSDIDLLVLLNNELSPEVREKLDGVFIALSQKYTEEIKNIELDMLLLSEVSKKTAVVNSQYTFRDNKPKVPGALDGFWIELANTRKNGIVLFGPEPSDVIPTIEMTVLIEANRQKFTDLQKNAEVWEKSDLWNQTYLLVQASRVLYSLNNGLNLASKQVALAWAFENAPEQFTEMLRVAQSKLDNFEGPREQVISDNWRDYFKYVKNQLGSKIDSIHSQ